MKRVFVFNSDMVDVVESVEFTITEDSNVDVWYNIYGRVIYCGNWKNRECRCEQLLKFCLEVDAPLLQEMHDLLTRMEYCGNEKSI